MSFDWTKFISTILLIISLASALTATALHSPAARHWSDSKNNHASRIGLSIAAFMVAAVAFSTAVGLNP